MTNENLQQKPQLKLGNFVEISLGDSISKKAGELVEQFVQGLYEEGHLTQSKDTSQKIEVLIYTRTDHDGDHVSIKANIVR